MTPNEPERPRPAKAPQASEVLLRDGSRVLVRQMVPEDEDLLADGFSAQRRLAQAAVPRGWLGSILPDELIVRALRAGVETFVAEVAAENAGALDFLFKAAPCRRKRLQAAVVELELTLTRARVLHAAA